MSWSCTTYCERLDFKLSFRMQSKSLHWDETQNFPVQEIDFHVRVFIKWRRKSSKMSLLRESGEISTHAKHDNLPSYGALDYFQMHFIVMGRVSNPSELIAKCKAKTSGLFSKKHAIKEKSISTHSKITFVSMENGSINRSYVCMKSLSRQWIESVIMSKGL